MELDGIRGEKLESLQRLFLKTRRKTLEICAPLLSEDFVIQTMDNISPPKWHLAHTSWFFEVFILLKFLKNYTPYHQLFLTLFNSYYETFGPFHPRTQRGFLMRPTTKEIYDYRNHVDEKINELINCNSILIDQGLLENLFFLLELGLQHEMQHQELLYTDIKYNFYSNPLFPSYDENVMELNNSKNIPLESHWISIDEGLYDIGASNNREFSFDNERPSHKVYLAPFSLSSHLVTNGEFKNFIEDGGYQKVELWPSDGLKFIREEKWVAPLYWEQTAEGWIHFTLQGKRPVDLEFPVCHISYYEAKAYSKWAKARLLSEAEWEVAARESNEMRDLFGQVWQWTDSAYSPYRGFKSLQGSLGEYNEKFMCNQIILRGSSWATSKEQQRFSYRNFFYPQDRWQFSGIRLGKDESI